MNTAPVIRYLFPANGPEITPLEQALRQMLLLAKQDDSIRDIVLMVPILGNLSGTSLETVLGSRVTKVLKDRKSIRLSSDGPSLRAETEKTYLRSTRPDAVLGVYVTKKILDQIDSTPRLKAVVVVPWTMGDHVEQWKLTWSPTVPGEDVSGSQLMMNPVVEKGLEAISRCINLSKGLLHPMDKSFAQHTLWALHKNSEWAEPDEMRAWAVRNGWTPEGADQLRSEAEKISNRKSAPKGYKTSWGNDQIQRFRE